jgi:hypothetical protein
MPRILQEPQSKLDESRREIYNPGGTFVAGTVFNTSGGYINIGRPPADRAQKTIQGFLEKEGLCVLFLGTFSSHSRCKSGLVVPFYSMPHCYCM